MRVFQTTTFFLQKHQRLKKKKKQQTKIAATDEIAFHSESHLRDTINVTQRWTALLRHCTTTHTHTPATS